MNDENLILSLKFRGQQHLLITSGSLSKELVGPALESLLVVEATLVHQDVESSELVFPEVDSRLGHVSVNHLREQTHIPHSVHTDTIDEGSLFS